MEAKATAALLGLFAVCGLIMAALTGLFALDHGATTTAALTFAGAIYTATVATFAKVVGRSGTAVVLQTALLVVGALVAVLGAALLHPAGVRLKPAA
ncbi:hypothetical protein [Streptomyces sp. NPDC050388]|uniref:hypothetical protein n=1 Tax=Streptomyces sp. NPDC050388 TaxID=3155781 RepID=UPI0034123402